MAEIQIDQPTLDSVRGKVVVIAGGAQGIGAATVSQLYTSGAHVFFGDWDEKKGSDLADELRASASTSAGSVTYLKVNVREYQSLLSLFDAAYNQHGHVDMAICCAAVTERPGYWEPDLLNLESVRETPTGIADVIDINLNGTLYFARLAVAYLKEKHAFDRASTTAESINSSKCITLVSSVAGFKESPGLFAYSAAKHGVVGLMRALRPFAAPLYGLRVNAICPWATDTQLLSGVRAEWVKNDMPMNQPSDVAKYIIQVTASPTAHGKALFVTGGNAVDIEEGINRTEPQWLGEKNSRELNAGQVILGLGMDWGHNGPKSAESKTNGTAT
ncbi:putative oxidoreductase,short chain dehydrogenase [Cladophialophora carrionii]|uniref:Putative oxidoreductase,short chain dehydrogenase n=1 Tax=Cladophialophora carrionii TaxID=86049 RepID=A0A1C1CUD1_9EURO|nr:putative oxidoreductase,short chain dehydrogenase [Cladophialophora carrionii]